MVPEITLPTCPVKQYYNLRIKAEYTNFRSFYSSDSYVVFVGEIGLVKRYCSFQSFDKTILFSKHLNVLEYNNRTYVGYFEVIIGFFYSSISFK